MIPSGKKYLAYFKNRAKHGVHKYSSLYGINTGDAEVVRGQHYFGLIRHHHTHPPLRYCVNRHFFKPILLKFVRCLKLYSFTIQTNTRARLCRVNKMFPTTKTSKWFFLQLESWTRAVKTETTISVWSAPMPRRKLRLSDTTTPPVVFASTSESVFMLATVRNSPFQRSWTRCGATIPVSLVIVPLSRYFSARIET